MIPEFEQNLLHLESSWEGLNEDSRTDGVVRNADVRLREEEDIIP